MLLILYVGWKEVWVCACMCMYVLWVCVCVRVWECVWVCFCCENVSVCEFMLWDSECKCECVWQRERERALNPEPKHARKFLATELHTKMGNMKTISDYIRLQEGKWVSHKSTSPHKIISNTATVCGETEAGG